MKTSVSARKYHACAHLHQIQAKKSSVSARAHGDCAQIRWIFATVSVLLVRLYGWEPSDRSLAHYFMYWSYHFCQISTFWSMLYDLRFFTYASQSPSDTGLPLVIHLAITGTA